MKKQKTMALPRIDISPSLLACDLANLASEGRKVLDAGADSLHVDVMDGHFVPNLSWGMPVVKSLHKALPQAFLDVHLMVSKPEQWVEDMRASGAKRYTFHVEATDDCDVMIDRIHELGMKSGIALKPGTPVDDQILKLAEKVDLVLIMTVEPGFGGQSFMPDMMSKVKMIREKFPELNIQVDGGLSPSTVDQAARAGANVIVAGSAVFKEDPPPKETIAVLRAAVQKAQEGGEAQ